MRGWAAYDGTTVKGSPACSGNDLSAAAGGYLPGGYVNLNTQIPGYRITCVFPVRETLPLFP
jgi:hypothetical protein